MCKVKIGTKKVHAMKKKFGGKKVGEQFQKESYLDLKDIV
jgi:hypothetical protein